MELFGEGQQIEEHLAVSSGWHLVAPGCGGDTDKGGVNVRLKDDSFRFLQPEGCTSCLFALTHVLISSRPVKQDLDRR